MTKSGKSDEVRKKKVNARRPRLENDFRLGALVCCDAGGGAGAVVGPGPVLFVEVALDALLWCLLKLLLQDLKFGHLAVGRHHLVELLAVLLP